MRNPRTYGKSPFNVVLVHGGPGAGGEMAPVARNLAPDYGILEPLQTQVTLSGQVNELWAVLDNHADPPVILVGFSWGAWLSYILTANYPGLVSKLILVGSGPFEHHYVQLIQDARLSRLTEDERTEYNEIIALLNDPNGIGKAGRFARLGQLAGKADHYDPVQDELLEGDIPESARDGNVFHEVLREAQEMRMSGELLTLADRIRCPVVAIHGNYDPHPAAGVYEPLMSRLPDFRFISIDHCGHKPWIERQAKDRFYQILRAELDVT
jgi:pimeloyl-ACP methyl ester carboxylesterase